MSLQAVELQVAMAQVLKDNEFKPVDLGLESNLQHLSSDVMQQAMDSSFKAVGSTVGVVLEGLLIKSTCNAISKLLAKAVAREAACLGVGLAGAPIPVVDIVTTSIAVIGTAWTAYDVHDAVDSLKSTRPVIRAGLTRSVADLKQQSLDVLSSQEQTVKQICINH